MNQAMIKIDIYSCGICMLVRTDKQYANTKKKKQDFFYIMSAMKKDCIRDGIGWIEQ